MAEMPGSVHDSPAPHRGARLFLIGQNQRLAAIKNSQHDNFLRLDDEGDADAPLEANNAQSGQNVIP